MLDVENLIEGVSVFGALAVIGAIVFAESGLLVGLFLPGDTLLFTAGLFAAHGDLPLAGSMGVIFIAAIIGDNVGYYFGQKAGPRIFKKRESLLFSRQYIEKAQVFYARHGGKTVMLARFIPYVRTFAPIVAGAANMHRLKFIIYNVAGALLWTITFVLLGYWLGLELAEEIEKYLVPAFILCFLFAFSPTIVYFIKRAKHNKVSRSNPDI